MSPTINLGKKKKRDRTLNKSSLHKWYNTTRWIRLRDAKRRDKPLCEDCALEGRVTPVEEVHHIRPINIDNPDPDMIYDFDNLVSLCVEHHKLRHKLIHKP